MSNSTYHLPARTYEEFQKKLNKMIENEDAATICGNIEWQRLGKNEYCYSGKYGDFVYDCTKFVPIYDEDGIEEIRSEMDDGSLDFPDNAFDFIEEWDTYLYSEPAFDKYICEWDLLEGEIPRGFNMEYIKDVTVYDEAKQDSKTHIYDGDFDGDTVDRENMVRQNIMADSKTHIYDGDFDGDTVDRENMVRQNIMADSKTHIYSVKKPIDLNQITAKANDIEFHNTAYEQGVNPEIP